MTVESMEDKTDIGPILIVLGIAIIIWLIPLLIGGVSLIFILIPSYLFIFPLISILLLLAIPLLLIYFGIRLIRK